MKCSFSVWLTNILWENKINFISAINRNFENFNLSHLNKFDEVYSRLDFTKSWALDILSWDLSSLIWLKKYFSNIEQLKWIISQQLISQRDKLHQISITKIISITKYFPEHWIDLMKWKYSREFLSIFFILNRSLTISIFHKWSKKYTIHAIFINSQYF